MNQFLKLVLRRNVTFTKNGRSNLQEPSNAFPTRYLHHKMVLPCSIYLNQNKNDNRNSNADFSRTFSLQNVDNNKKDGRTVILAKTLPILGRRRKIRDALGDRQRRLKEGVENVLEGRRIALIVTRRRLQEKSKLLIQDIKDTKHKMKEKFEEVIERENVYTIPNLLCITRIGLSPLLGYLIISKNFEFALAFVFISGISDWVDGWIARNFKNQSSKIGSFLDPMADKVLIGTLFLSLTYVDLIPVPLTALIIGRDIILIISGFVIRYNSLPPPRTISRYFDVTHATAQLAPTLISKINTGIQLILVGTTLAAPVLGYVNHQFLHVLWYATAGSTIAAASSYIFSKETYKYFKPKRKSKRDKEINR